MQGWETMDWFKPYIRGVILYALKCELEPAEFATSMNIWLGEDPPRSG